MIDFILLIEDIGHNLNCSGLYFGNCQKIR